ncbi:SigF/SigG family RNA polymerase sporulation sigma factor [Acetohalobium arabaticum]|uniref:RNA polymerase sigma factor n=1 Tax=Acetohalobium arabaticum (strain ATCC 49924 / DSM 5501 / Z-7288) TaxID=574087 RepID=D9QRR9_ACEAZ|nr:SigF/SigG family RNA polymerase sporulation sigma factor [Acetohalobium arabaticum]ADL13210.1 RNA polymerase, sigma subunit, RpoX/SigF [Acetohalobium arabaticum DSM 5501]
MNNNSLNIPQKELLSEAETKELLKKAQAGDQKAKDKLVNHNVKLVLKVAHRFANKNYDYEELFQIGSIGLLKAIERFDLERDVKFSTYAVPLIIGEIKRFLRDDDAVKVSRSLKRRAHRINEVKESLTAELNREPTIQEIAEEMEVDKEEIVNALEAVREPTSIYSPVYENEGNSIELVDQLAASSENQEQEIDRLALREVIDELKTRERLILKLRFFDEKTQQEVADRIGVSQVQVSRLERKIIDKVREELD